MTEPRTAKKEEWEEWIATGSFMQWSMDGVNWCDGINDGANFFRIVEEGKDDIIFKLTRMRKAKIHKTDYTIADGYPLYVECCEGEELNMANKCLQGLMISKGWYAPKRVEP